MRENEIYEVRLGKYYNGLDTILYLWQDLKILVSDGT